MLTRWESVTFQTNLVTRKIVVCTNTFTEIGAGLNVRDQFGNFIAADPSFEITPAGAEARGTMHSVSVPADIYDSGIVIVQPAGQRLIFQPLAINYYDPADGRSLLLASITNATGWLVASNEIVWSNCFVGLKASVRIKNTPAGLEQDILLHERPADPAALGLSPLARIEAISEQLEGPLPGRREPAARVPGRCWLYRGESSRRGR